MEFLPLAIVGFWLILGALALTERERWPATATPSTVIASMAPPRSRDLIPETTVGATMAGLSPAMTSARVY